LFFLPFTDGIEVSFLAKGLMAALNLGLAAISSFFLASTSDPSSLEDVSGFSV
jgi:hypothetical protein